MTRCGSGVERLPCGERVDSLGRAGVRLRYGRGVRIVSGWRKIGEYVFQIVDTFLKKRYRSRHLCPYYIQCVHPEIYLYVDIFT